MEKKEIKITVTGQTNTGKSTIMWSLYKLLKENGIEVEINDPDMSFENLKKKMMRTPLEVVYRKIEDKVKVKINGLQTY